MSKTITVRDAQIKTAAVEIKSLTVSGKQVTMGVFRQLLSEPLIDADTGELMGVPWGKVNYFPKPCDPDHLHIVWQKGSELRRACLYRHLEYAVRREYREELEALNEEIAPAAELCLIVEALAEKPPVVDEDARYYRWEHEGSSANVALCGGEYGNSSTALGKYLKSSAKDLAGPGYFWGYRDPLGPALIEALLNRQFELASQIGVGSHEGAASAAVERISRYCKRRSEQEAHRKKHEQHYAELEVLDQLFIAV